MNPVVASDKLKRTEVWAEDDESVHWAGAFAVYGGHGTTASSTIVYEIEPGKRLGWHTDATEETQYIIAGDGELHMEDGSEAEGWSWQRFCPADTGETRSRQRRKRNVARGRIFRGGDVHAKFRQRDAAAEKPHPRHAESRRIACNATVLVVRRVLRLRRVSAVRRLRLLDHREDLHQGLRGYRARRMIRDDWRVLCEARRFVRL